MNCLLKTLYKCNQAILPCLYALTCMFTSIVKGCVEIYIILKVCAKGVVKNDSSHKYFLNYEMQIFFADSAN